MLYKSQVIWNMGKKTMSECQVCVNFVLNLHKIIQRHSVKLFYCVNSLIFIILVVAVSVDVEVTQLV